FTARLDYVILFFFFQRYGPHPLLLSFPTRRSSDLTWPPRAQAGPTQGQAGTRHRRTGPIVRHRQSLPPRGLSAERGHNWARMRRSEEHTSELQSRGHLVCRLLLEKKKRTTPPYLAN